MFEISGPLRALRSLYTIKRVPLSHNSLVLGGESG